MLLFVQLITVIIYKLYNSKGGSMKKSDFFKLAFLYRKTKVWNFLWDTEIFAIKLDDGQIGYVSITGREIDDTCTKRENTDTLFSILSSYC